MLCYLCHISEQRKKMKAKMNHTAVLISKTLLVTVKTYKIPAPGLIFLGSLDEMDTAQKMASTISIHVNLKHKQMCLSVNRSQRHLGHTCMCLPCIFISL